MFFQSFQPHWKTNHRDLSLQIQLDMSKYFGKEEKAKNRINTLNIFKGNNYICLAHEDVHLGHEGCPPRTCGLANRDDINFDHQVDF